MAITATTPTSERPQRPMFLSADKRKISYKSKTGKTFTLEFKNSHSAEIKNSTSAVESLRDNLQKITVTTPAVVDEKKATLQKDAAPQAAALTLPAQGLWYGVYDTVAMLIEESLEVACFGPYDEPAAT